MTENLHPRPLTQTGRLVAFLSTELLLSRGKLGALCEKKRNTLTLIEIFSPITRVSSSHKREKLFDRIQKLQFSQCTQETEHQGFNIATIRILVWRGGSAQAYKPTQQIFLNVIAHSKFTNH